ncbi:CBS domain containing-hemolysin-like protein [Brachybacterium sp. AG952]|uniref:hemolysin family protein n=1 Tax=Brachybacterium sp. AG952 TaxID=2183989 RepID=UPI00105DF5E6|nr:hemolysin family protein [Brachybacterium sp. AG952]TDP79676.1 CBS domain containing-hemolysin-like protein [Brachybacterium sp. AG952]
MDLIGPLVSLAIGLLLVLACGAFVAAEFSLITVNRNDVEAAAESGDKRAGGVLRGMKTLSTQLSGAQLGITVTNLGIGFLAEPAIAALVGPPLVDAGLSEVAARSASVALALVLATGMTMIFGELVPKNMAIAQPLRTAKLVVGFQRLFSTIFGLPIRLFNGNANAVVRALGVEPQEELSSARSADELSVLVKRSADEGALAEETASLVQRTLAFGDRRAHDAMVPRGRVDSLEVDQTVADLLELARETGHSRFPVQDDENEIAGVAHIRHGLAVPFDERPTTRVDAVMGPATFVPDTVPLDDLMDTLRAGGLQMAVVVDEFGDHAGLITLEDLVEEIVGEVRDEHDEETDDTPEPDGSWDLDARMRPDEATERLGVTVPEHEDYDTLGGLVTMELGRLAEVGDEIVVDTDPAPGEEPARLRIVVVEIDGMRIETVHVIVEAAPDETDVRAEDEEVSR